MDLFAACERHLDSITALGIAKKPKHHALMEMATRTWDVGSPALWACWLDESLNKTVRDLGAHAHKLVWNQRVLTDFINCQGSTKDTKKRKVERP